MCFFKEKSIIALFVFLFLALFLTSPQFVYSQISFDTNAPYILEVDPTDGQTMVPINTSINVLFNEVIDTDNPATNNAFTINPSVNGQISWELDQTLIFLPYTFFNYDNTYVVNIDTQISDLSGNPLEEDYQWSFTTESSPWLHFYEIEGLSLDQNNVKVILGLDNGDIWIALSSSGSSDDLFVFNGTDFDTIDVPLGHINALVQNNNGDIVVASDSDTPNLGGVHIYDGTNWTHYNSENSGLLDNSISCLAVDSLGNILAGSQYSGMYLFDGISWTNYDESYGLSNNWVSTIAVDEYDVVWIGTPFGDKIESLDQQTDTWTSYASSIESQLNLISAPSVNELVYGSGRIWARTDLGLLICDIDIDEWELITQTEDTSLEGSLTSLAWDSINELLCVGTFDSILLFEGTTWDDIIMKDAGPDILDIAVDAFGNKWIGTSNSLSKLDKTPPLLLSFSPGANQKNVPRNSTISLTFTEPMDRASVIGAFGISPSKSFTSSWNTRSTKLTITPTSQFSSDKKYKITLGKAATDVQGNQLTEGYSWSFTTKSTTLPSSGFPSPYTSPTGFYPPTTFTSLFGNLAALNLSRMLTSQFRPGLTFGGFQYPTFGGFPFPSIPTPTFRGLQYPTGGFRYTTGGFQQFPTFRGFPTSGRGYTYTYPRF